jgi:uncharacterized SAM-binding protein YcdF (DUF218 family)
MRPMLRLVKNLLTTCALLACLVLGGGFLLFVSGLERSETDSRGTADGIVALTGGAERIPDAIELLARGLGTRLLITGVNEKTTREEIARQRPDLRDVFGCCVDLDYEALNTIGNAEQTKRWAEQHNFRSLLIVTSSYHMPRTLAELEHAMPGVRLLAHAVVPEHLDLDAWWREPAIAKLLAIEYVKYVVAVARIHLDGEGIASTVARASSTAKETTPPGALRKG